MKHSTAKDPKRREARNEAIKECHTLYIDSCTALLDRVEITVNEVRKSPSTPILAATQIPVIQNFVNHGRRQVDQIRRRVLEGETIPHHEKVFGVVNFDAF